MTTLNLNNSKISSPASNSSNSRISSFASNLSILFLVVLNLLLVWSFFGKEVFIIFSQAPLMPLLSRILDLTTPLNFGQSQTLLIACSFPFAIISLALFIKELSGKSLLTPFSLVIFSSPFFFSPRLELFSQEGAGNFLFAFALFPLSGLFLLRFLRKGAFSNFFWTNAFFTCVALISPFALINLIIFLTIVTISEMLVKEGRVKLTRFLLILLFGWGFSAFWYHPAFLWEFFKTPQGKALLSTFGKLIPTAFFTIPILGTSMFLLFDRKPVWQPFTFSFLLSLFYLALILAAKAGIYLPGVGSKEFLPEFLLGVSLFLGLLMTFFGEISTGKIAKLRFLGINFGFTHHTKNFFLLALLGFFLGLTLFYLPTVKEMDLSPNVLGVQSASLLTDFSPGGTSSLFGYTVTLGTAILTLFLQKKSQNKE